MPVGAPHDVERFDDEFHRHVFVEQIAHGIHENGLGLLPFQRQFQRVLVQGEVKAVGIIRLAHGFEAQRHPLGVAMLARRTNLGATGKRVPRGFRPLNGRIIAHANDQFMRSHSQEDSTTMANKRRILVAFLRW